VDHIPPKSICKCIWLYSCNNDLLIADKLHMYVLFAADQPNPPVNPATYHTQNPFNMIKFKPNDSIVTDINMIDITSGSGLFEQEVLYNFILKIHSPLTNKTSYCPMVCMYMTLFHRRWRQGMINKFQHQRNGGKREVGGHFYWVKRSRYSNRAVSHSNKTVALYF